MNFMKILRQMYLNSIFKVVYLNNNMQIITLSLKASGFSRANIIGPGSPSRTPIQRTFGTSCLPDDLTADMILTFQLHK